MRDVKISVLAICMLALTLPLSAQISIGQKCPDVTVGHVINYRDSSLNLRDFRGKWVILDFWGIHCSACVGEMPLMDSLQSVYGDKLQILMVNRENSTVTKNHLAKYKGLKVPLLPFITGDTVLSGFFPHRLVPLLIWIDPLGTVRYMTSGTDASFAHVRDVLDGKDIKMVVMKEIPFPKDLPLLTIKDTNVQNHIYYYSYLMRGIYQDQSGFWFDKKGGSKIFNHVKYNAVPALWLFVHAFEEGNKYDFRPRNTIILQIPHPDQFVFPTEAGKISEWMSRYSYTYEIMVPPSRAAHLYQFMQQDLQRYFGMKATVEKRMVKCLALIRVGKTDALKTKGGKFFTGVIDSGKVWRFRNHSFASFFRYLRSIGFESHLCPEPLIDKTGYKGNIDIDLKADIIKKLNIPELKRELVKYGLAIKPEVLPTTVLVIRPEGTGSLN